MISRRMFFKAGPACAIGAAVQAIPSDVLRQAWIQGSNAQRAGIIANERKKDPDWNPPSHWKPADQYQFTGTEYDAGMRAAAEVILKHLARNA